ncbi:MAG: glycosyltransferase family 4 protein [Anaerolineae bacterium]|nr:glycosyltransferase family 4 protein [Anaerolineae bacterium]
MIEVAALTSGMFTPSSRFRVRQHIGSLLEKGIRVRDYTPIIPNDRRLPGWPMSIPEKYALPIYVMWQAMKLATRIPGTVGSWRAQITWLQRELLPTYLTLEPILKRPLVFDVDDAIWLGHHRNARVMRAIAECADVVIAGNSFIADWFSQYAQDVRIVHTAVDTTRFVPRDPIGHPEFVVGWTGSGENLAYLKEIEDVLARFLADHVNTTMIVVADRPPAFSRIRATYVAWSPELEVNAVQDMDVGLMPLPDNDWARGKCAFKLVQYMACGIPSVVSAVGFNNEILAMDRIGFGIHDKADWYEALSYLYHHRNQAKEYGRRARILAERRFSHTAVSAQLADVFHELS